MLPLRTVGGLKMTTEPTPEMSLKQPDLKQPDPRKFVDSVTTDNTVQPPTPEMSKERFPHSLSCATYPPMTSADCNCHVAEIERLRRLLETSRLMCSDAARSLQDAENEEDRLEQVNEKLSTSLQERETEVERLSAALQNRDRILRIEHHEREARITELSASLQERDRQLEACRRSLEFIHKESESSEICYSARHALLALREKERP